MRRIFKVNFVSCLATGILFLSGCGLGSKSEVSEVFTMPFAEWCASSGSTNCDLPSTFPNTQKEWDIGLDVFAQVIGSSSQMEVGRKDFEHKELLDLFDSLGAGDLLCIIRSLPWVSLKKSLEGFLLSNETDDAEVAFNGLKLRGAKAVSVQMQDHKVRVTGVSLQESTALRSIKYLDLSKAGLVDVVTDSIIITGVPIAYFANVSTVKQNSSTIDIGRMVKAISTLAIDEDFSWRSKITLLLMQRELQNIDTILKELGPRDPVSDSVFSVLAASSHVLVGGEGTRVIAGVSRSTPASCDFKVVNVPILGKLNLKLKFASGLGLQNLRKGTGDVLVTADVFGIETNYGKVKALDVEADRLILRVGSFKIPLEFEPKVPDQGDIRVESGACKEG